MKNLFLLFISTLFIWSCTNSQNKEDAAGSSNITRYVRKNAHSKEAEKDLEAMQKALEIMRTLNCSDPTSWYYQGAIHSVPLVSGSEKPNPNPFCDSFQFNASQLKTAWANCTHGGDDAMKKSITYNFLIWHRLYIWHFEKIVRELSGKEDFALPYWAYTNTENAELYQTLPPALRNSKSSLFEKARYIDVNEGKPIIDEETLSALNLKDLFEEEDFYDFAKSINGVPHGTMHDYIGAGPDTTAMYFNPIFNKEMNSGLMGVVASAGFDPVFWLHHSNIDRIWQQWTNSDKGTEVCLDTLKKYAWSKYTFFDAKGKQVDYTVDDVYKIIYNEMDYNYDDTEVKGKKTMTECKPLLKSQAAVPQNLAISEKSFAISKTSSDITISNNLFGKKTGLKSQGSPQKVVLTFDIEFPTNKIPRSTFQVYLNPTPGKELTTSDTSFCGFINFFEIRSALDHHSNHGNHSEPLTEKVEMNISQEVVQTNALSKKDFKIVIRGVKDIGVTIKNIKIVGR